MVFSTTSKDGAGPGCAGVIAWAAHRNTAAATPIAFMPANISPRLLRKAPHDDAYNLAKPAMHVTPGTAVGAYRIEALVGERGVGQVYRARDTRLHRAVAIKMLRGDVDRLSRQRFEREAIAASGLNHPHILTVHEVGEVGGHPYLVTEFVVGGTFAVWAHAALRPAREILELLSGVADGLAAAH